MKPLARRETKGPGEHHYTVYVTGIPPELPTTTIKHYFKSFGQIDSIQHFYLSRDPSGSAKGQIKGDGKVRRNFCHVHCKNYFTWNQIMNHHGHYLGGRMIYCEQFKKGPSLYSKNKETNKRRVFLRRVPCNATSYIIEEVLTKIAGPVESKVLQNRKRYDQRIRTSRHCSWSVTFADRASLNRLFQQYNSPLGVKIMGQPIFIERHDPKKVKSKAEDNVSKESEILQPDNSQQPELLNNPLDQNNFQKQALIQTLPVPEKDSEFPSFCDEFIKIQHKPTQRNYYNCRFSYSKPLCKGNHQTENIRINVLPSAIRSQTIPS